MEGLSHFEERGGIVTSKHEWGRWSQSVREVNVEVNLEPGTKAKELAVCIRPNHLQCRLANNSREFLNVREVYNVISTFYCCFSNQDVMFDFRVNCLV